LEKRTNPSREEKTIWRVVADLELPQYTGEVADAFQGYEVAGTLDHTIVAIAAPQRGLWLDHVLVAWHFDR